MKTKAIRAYTPIVRLMSAMLALVLVIMAFPTTAFASYDYTAANTLTIPFIQLTSNELNTQQKFSSTLSYKSPNLGKVLAHVMDVVGDDGEFGVGFCGDHNLHLGNDNIGSDTWVYSGIWSPNGSRPFLDYYYAKNYESDLIRQECPGQTDGWYAQALNTEEWGYAMYVTPAQRYSLNTLVQIAIWLDRTGKLGDLPSAATFCSGWNAVKQTRLQVEELQLQRENLERSVAMQVNLAVDNIKINVKQIASCSESVRQADRAHTIMEKSFDIGAASYLNLRDSELALTQARLAYFQAIYNYLVAGSELELLLGNAPLEKYATPQTVNQQ